MNNDYWKKYLEKRKHAEELHSAEEVVEETAEEVAEEVAEEAAEEAAEETAEETADEMKVKLVIEKGPVPVEGQVRNNGLSIFRNGEWVKRFP